MTLNMLKIIEFYALNSELYVCELYLTKAVTKLKTNKQTLFGLFSEGMRLVHEPGEVSKVSARYDGQLA